MMLPPCSSSLDIAKGVMYSSLAAERGASQAQSTAVAIPWSPLFSVSLLSLLFLFSSVFCILNFVLLGQTRAKMFIVYMLPYYIEIFCCV